MISPQCEDPVSVVKNSSILHYGVSNAPVASLTPQPILKSVLAILSITQNTLRIPKQSGGKADTGATHACRYY